MKKKIMIVEDDSFLMDAYKLKLTHTDFDIITANNGEEALDVYQKNQPDLIILDILMPKLDGIGFLKQFKKVNKDRVIPIIVATNNDQPEVTKEAISLGAADVFIKSDISIKDLVAKCSKLLVS